MNFWKKLKKPILILAPMEGVTDTVFRQIVVSVGKPDVFFTEFVPVDALFSKGQEKILASLKFTKKERPVVAQIWGTDPEKFCLAAQMLSKLKFDGIDINMGCPDKNAVKSGACAALLKNFKLAQEIITATIKGSKGLPVSVKTRIGYKEINTENWVTALLQTPVSALTLHLRTVFEMSKVPAHWDELKSVLKIRENLKSKALIIGNGDIKTIQEAKDKCKEYKIDGAMIGRGIFENVWLFNESIDVSKITPKHKIKLLQKHLQLFKKTYGGSRHFELMKKFVKCYVSGFDGASEKRIQLMQTKTLDRLIETAGELNGRI
ncbi:tRNA-dihydrouridine synthase [Candidatus Daviesbacteria bacterium]|nr:tRNA-dihydrouridine synthase [Candidatus Daviesbacteria bacterium]